MDGLVKEIHKTPERYKWYASSGLGHEDAVCHVLIAKEGAGFERLTICR